MSYAPSGSMRKAREREREREMVLKVGVAVHSSSVETK
jgi:hypothetical protein